MKYGFELGHPHCLLQSLVQEALTVAARAMTTESMVNFIVDLRRIYSELTFDFAICEDLVVQNKNVGQIHCRCSKYLYTSSKPERG